MNHGGEHRIRAAGEVAIRPAVAADAAGLARFAAATFREAFGPDNTAADMALYLDAAFGPDLQLAEIENPAVDTLLALDRDALVGYIQLWRGEPPDCVQPRDAVEIRRLYVEADWRRRGLARRLMGLAFDLARGHGAGAVWLGVWERNLRARAFYDRLGFAEAGEQRFMLGTDRQTDKILVRQESARPQR